MARTDIPHGLTSAEPRVGCAGWAIRREHSGRFANIGTHLQRYATLFNCVEVNSCFYRPHRFSTYERWAASVPDDFRFAVKLPKVITHELRLVGAEPALEQFLGETSGLGIKRGPILVQLAPSFAFDADSAEPFFKELRNRFEGDVVFAGQVPEEEVARWLRTARVLVSMSEHEAFGLTVSEALAAGARTVVSDIPAHRELAERTPPGRVTLVPFEGGSERLAEALLRATDGDASPQPFDVPSWDDVATATLELYEEVAASIWRHSSPARRSAGSNAFRFDARDTRR